MRALGRHAGLAAAAKLLLLPNFKELVRRRSELTGNYRTAHSRLIAHAEEISFYEGGKRCGPACCCLRTACCCQRAAACALLPAAGCLLPAACVLLPAYCCRLPAACLLPAAGNCCTVLCCGGKWCGFRELLYCAVLCWCGKRCWPLAAWCCLPLPGGI